MTTTGAQRKTTRRGFISSSIVGGLLVVLPIWLSLFVILKLLGFVRGLLKPVSQMLPDDVNYQNVIAAFLIAAFCFIVGLLARSGWGARLIGGLERLCAIIPGYRTLRSMIHSLLGSPIAEGWTPALIRTDETEQPGFVIEHHEDGKFTVFVPGAPTPMSGDVHVIDGWRVRMVSAGTPEIIRVLTRFGEGAEKVRRSAEPAKPPPGGAD